MHVEEHIANSVKRTSKEYREMHEWMDCWKDNPKLSEERHDLVKVYDNSSYVEKEWGAEAKSEFLHHMKEDHENKKGTILTILEFVKRKFFWWL